MADLEAFYRVHLNEEFARRKAKNSRYSMRSFARNLDLDNGYLSRLLSGKVLLSLDLADSLTKKLSLSKETRAQFLMSAADEQRCHALYLIDPSLTECDSDLHETNLNPLPRRFSSPSPTREC